MRNVVLNEDQLKEAVAVWYNCHYSKEQPMCDKNNVLLQYIPKKDKFRAEVWVDDGLQSD